MKSLRRPARALLLAALTLPAVGCGGCQVNIGNQLVSALDAEMRKVVGEMYLQGFGPQCVAGAVGAAAPPGGLGGLSGLCMEMAGRDVVERELNRPGDLQAVAGAVGAAAAPGPAGGWSAVAMLDARWDQGKLPTYRWQIPSVFATRLKAGPPAPADRAAQAE
jgi:hypothetical protein